MAIFIIRYGEIGLKGKNRGVFEEQLRRNIADKLEIRIEQIRRQQGQLRLRIKDEHKIDAIKGLKQVFGIVWFAQIYECDSNLEQIKSKTMEMVRQLQAETFAIRARRADKRLPFTSKHVENSLGETICKKTNMRVNLSQPELTIGIRISKQKSVIYNKRISGPGGLPVGTSGRVLGLLSGGFDSIAAAYMMAKRGARVDFIHFHVFPTKDSVLNTKMPKIWNKLPEYTLSKRVFLASYLPFQMQVLALEKRRQKYELVVFRRLMARTAEALAEKYGYQALLLGDSLGQVASQTMENMLAMDSCVKIPIFRPLVGMDKQEVVDLVNRIGLGNEAITPYKDCCSIVSTKPATRANMEKVEKIEKDLEIEKVIKEVVERIERIEIEKTSK